jgi:NADPH:quinone reductase-like Zn-dependent oxidoreductase
MEQLMRAVRFHTYGAEDVLVLDRVPLPLCGPNEALVAVEACGVNHVDLDIRSGVSRFNIAFPHILGREIVGRVVAVGQTANEAWLGKRILVSPHIACGRCRYCAGGRTELCEQRQLPGVTLPGGYAEYAAAPVDALIPVADRFDAAEAASVPVAFGAAWHALIGRGSLRVGETALIMGASGGVGSAAVQVAAKAGAFVLAVVGSDKKAEGMRGLGASASINHHSEPLVPTVMELTGGAGVDVVLDLVGGHLFQQGLQCLCRGGRLVVAGAHGGEKETLDLIELFRNERCVIGTGAPSPNELESVLALVEAGALVPVIAEVVDLAEAGHAHRVLAERRSVGKVVLRVADSAA